MVPDTVTQKWNQLFQVQTDFLEKVLFHPTFIILLNFLKILENLSKKIIFVEKFCKKFLNVQVPVRIGIDDCGEKCQEQNSPHFFFINESFSPFSHNYAP